MQKFNIRTQYYSFQGIRQDDFIEGIMKYVNNIELIQFQGKIFKYDQKGNIIEGSGILDCKSNIYESIQLVGYIKNNYLSNQGDVILNKKIKINGIFTIKQQLQLIQNIKLDINNIFTNNVIVNKTVYIGNMTFCIEKIGNIVSGKIYTPNFNYAGQFSSQYPYLFQQEGTATHTQQGIIIYCQQWNKGEKNGVTTIEFEHPSEDNIISQTAIYKDNQLVKNIQLKFKDKQINFQDDGLIKISLSKGQGYYIGKELDKYKMNGEFQYINGQIIQTNFYKDDQIIQKIKYEDQEKIVTYNNDNVNIQYKKEKKSYIGQINNNFLPEGKGILKKDNKEYDGYFINGMKQGIFKISSKSQVEVLKYKNDQIVQHFWKYQYKLKIYTKYDKDHIKYTFTGNINKDYLPNGQGILNDTNAQYQCVMQNGQIISKSIIKQNKVPQLTQQITYRPSESATTQQYSEEELLNIHNSGEIRNKTIEPIKLPENILDTIKSTQQTSKSQQSDDITKRIEQELKQQILGEKSINKDIQLSQQQDKQQEQQQKLNQSDDVEILKSTVQPEKQQQQVQLNNTIYNEDTITYFETFNTGRILDRDTGELIYQGELNEQGEAYGMGIMFLNHSQYVQGKFFKNEIVHVIKQDQI